MTRTMTTDKYGTKVEVPPTDRPLMLSDMHRLIENLDANYKLPQRRPIVEVFRATFPTPPAPKPSNTQPATAGSGESELQVRYDALYAQNMNVLAALSTAKLEAGRAKGELAALTARAEAAEKVCGKVAILNGAKAIRCRPRKKVGPEKRSRLTLAWIELNRAYDAWLASLSATGNTTTGASK